MKNELISVVMPAYNCEQTLVDSIDSVLCQTMDDFILYIVNDASADLTESIILNYNDPRIHYVKNKHNLGVAESRNQAIKIAKGKYMAFLDSDDLWEPKKLEKQILLLEAGCDVVFSNYKTFSISSDNIINIRKSKSIISYKDLLKSNYIGNLTGIYNIENLGKFYQKKVGHEDYLMWLEIVKKAGVAYCVNECLASYRLSPQSLSADKKKAIQWQWNIYRKHLKMDLLSSSYYFINYLLQAVKKRM